MSQVALRYRCQQMVRRISLLHLVYEVKPRMVSIGQHTEPRSFSITHLETERIDALGPGALGIDLQILKQWSVRNRSKNTIQDILSLLHMEAPFNG